MGREWVMNGDMNKTSDNDKVISHVQFLWISICLHSGGGLHFFSKSETDIVLRACFISSVEAKRWFRDGEKYLFEVVTLFMRVRAAYK
mmetsp:Transcript_15214/g.19056  ORF Transcript_15214/g.19056 Transcript_15214/m.19056 type:complete len:88 (-) Transcript_15214:1015-1278(-)